MGSTSQALTPQVGLPQHNVQNVLQTPAASTNRRHAYANSSRQAMLSLSPLHAPIMAEVNEAARRRANEYLRYIHQGLPPAEIEQRLYKPDDTIPPLLLLIEAYRFLEQPKKHDALNAMRDLQVSVSVFMPSGQIDPDAGIDLGIPIEIQWRRTIFTFVPYEARQVPVHVAIQLLNQIWNFNHSMDVEFRVKGDVQIPVQRKLRPEERPQVGFLPFRDPTEAERTGQHRLQHRYSQQAVVPSQHGGGELIINMNPRAQQQMAQSLSAPAPVQGQGTSQSIPKPAMAAPTDQGGMAPPPPMMS